MAPGSNSFSGYRYWRKKSLMPGSSVAKRLGNRKNTASCSVRGVWLVKATSSVPSTCGLPGAMVASR